MFGGSKGDFFPCVVESFVGDGLTSQSRYSSPTGSGFTPTVTSDGTVWIGEVQHSTFERQAGRALTVQAVTTLLVENYVPLAASLQICRIKSNWKDTPFNFVVRVAYQSSSC